MELFLNDKLGTISLEIDEAENAGAVVIIAHGAGAGMHHSFLVKLANELNDLGLHVVRFNFPYIEQGKKAPGSPKHAITSWGIVAEIIHEKNIALPVFISGKSYGGRMASHLLAEKTLSFVKGIVYYGFPLHAPGRDSGDRAAHLNKIQVPQLFIQGTKDKFANFQMMNEVVKGLSQAQIIEIVNGDHSFNLPKSSRKNKDEVIRELAIHTADWIRAVMGGIDNG